MYRRFSPRTIARAAADSRRSGGTTEQGRSPVPLSLFEIQDDPEFDPRMRRYLSELAHELRSPLCAITGFAHLLELDDKIVTGESRNHVEQILNGAEYVLRLIEKNLPATDAPTRERPDAHPADWRPFSIRGPVEAAVKLMTTEAERAGVSIELAMSDADYAALPRLLGEPIQFRQVLVNLLSNAIKYNRPGGSVRVFAREGGFGETRVCVADTGVGIATGYWRDVFKPFNRLAHAHSTIPGSGLGLSLSKRIMDNMGGLIGFTSALGSGSTFWVSLPTEGGATN